MMPRSSIYRNSNRTNHARTTTTTTAKHVGCHSKWGYSLFLLTAFVLLQQGIYFLWYRPLTLVAQYDTNYLNSMAQLRLVLHHSLLDPNEFQPQQQQQQSVQRQEQGQEPHQTVQQQQQLRPRQHNDPQQQQQANFASSSSFSGSLQPRPHLRSATMSPMQEPFSIANAQRRRSMVSSSSSVAASSAGTLPDRIRARTNNNDPRMNTAPRDLFLLEKSTTANPHKDDTTNNAAAVKTTPTAPYITSPQQVYDYRWHHRHVIPLDEPLIYFVTPTHNNDHKNSMNPSKRRTVQEQLADLTTLGQTLWLDGNIYWIVVEDSVTLNPQIRALLLRMGLPFAHVATPTVKPHPDMANHRGIDQRNRALSVVEDLLLWTTMASSLSNVSSSSSSSSPSEKKHDKMKNESRHQTMASQFLPQGVVYFGDDDNTYDVRIFHALRQTKTVGVLPVGLVGSGPYERCVVHRSGKVYSIASAHRQEERQFPMDMAGFAFVASQLLDVPPPYMNNDKNNHHDNHQQQQQQLQYQRSSRNIRFHWEWPGGFLETRFLEQLVRHVSELNPLAEDCTKLYVWHTKSKALTIAQEMQQRQRKRQPQASRAQAPPPPQQKQLQRPDQPQQERRRQRRQEQQEQQRRQQRTDQQQGLDQPQRTDQKRRRQRRHQLQRFHSHPQEHPPDNQGDKSNENSVVQQQQPPVAFVVQGDDDFVWNGGGGWVYHLVQRSVPQFPPRPLSSEMVKRNAPTLYHNNALPKAVMSPAEAAMASGHGGGGGGGAWDHIAPRVGGIAAVTVPRREK